MVFARKSKITYNESKTEKLEPRSKKNEVWCSYDFCYAYKPWRFHVASLLFEFDSAMQVRSHGLSQKCHIAGNEAKSEKWSQDQEKRSMVFL